MEILLGWLAVLLYLVAFAAYLVAFQRRQRGSSAAGAIVLLLAAMVHLAAVIVRGRFVGHLPFASKFEALLFYSFVTVVLTIVVGTLQSHLPVVLLTLPIVISFLLGSLLGGDKAPAALPPVLDSPFFLIHVVTVFIGYAFYSVAFGLAVGGLFAGSDAPSPQPLPPDKERSVRRLGTATELLGLARQMVPWGLIFLGAGIGLGSIWAMFSWGNWWGWDPKENAALATWLGYVLYVHSPAWKRTPRKSDAVYIIAAYLLLIVTFLAVNLLRRGLHAYQ